MAVSGNPVIAMRGKKFSGAARDMPDEAQDSAMDLSSRQTIDALPVAVAQCDRHYVLRFANNAYARMHGVVPEDMVGKRLPDLIGDAAFAAQRPCVDAALRGAAQEQQIRKENGRWLQATYLPAASAAGGERRMTLMLCDITLLKNTEERLLRREREFKTLVADSPDIISRIDRDMRHLYVNPAIEKLAGIEAAAYLGKTKAELGLPANIVQAWEDAARAAFATRAEQRLAFDHVLDGQTRNFSGRVIPDIDDSGQLESVVGIAYDVTARARAEKERDELLMRERTARIQAETAARARDEFLSIVSHELRAPLNGIQSWAHVLENYVKDVASAPLAQRALQGIKAGIGQQVRLIEDLLDVTRMMSGKLRLIRQPLALVPVLQAAVDSVHAAAQAKRITLACNFQITTEQTDGDADRVQQVLWNLLSNAIKFTPEGGHVWVDAVRAGKDIRITVRDDGAGISPAFLPHLFDRFSQEDMSSTRGHNGLGLGLFLVRHLVELHGGRVDAHSEGEGKGTSFTVCLPLRAAADQYPTVIPSDDAAGFLPLPSLAGLHILLVDDQAEARESLTVVLTTAGANVFAAESATNALAWLQTRKKTELPDVMVCDIAMPGEDGYSVLRRIKAWKADDDSMPLARMPALALTAFAQREDRIRALTAGFQMHVTKPVAPEELIVVIDMLVPRQ